MATTKTETAAKEKGALGRRTLRKLGRDKRKAKIQTDKEYAKTLFASRSKRSTDKKAAFKKKKSGRK
jgi:hypothetical protein